MKVTGEQLRALRETARIGLRRMAVHVHYPAGYLSLIETGRKPVTPGIAAAYARVLGVDLDTGMAKRCDQPDDSIGNGGNSVAQTAGALTIEDLRMVAYSFGFSSIRATMPPG